MENLDKLKSKCVSAYTYIQLMGEYAADQFEDAMECEPSAEKMRLLSSTTMKLLKKIHQKLDSYFNEINKLSEPLNHQIPPVQADVDSSEVSSIVADVKDIKLVTDETTIPQNDDNEDKEDRPEVPDSDNENSDITMCSFQSENDRALEALENLGGGDVPDIDSLSDSSQDSRSSSSHSRRSASLSSAEKSLKCNAELVSHEYTDHYYCSMYNVEQCYVLVEDIKNECTNRKSKMNDSEKEKREIERLTNMDTLENAPMSKNQSGIHSKRPKHRKANKDSSDSDANSDTSSALDDDEVLKNLSDADLPSILSNADENMEDNYQDLLSLLGKQDADETNTNTDNESEGTDEMEKPKKEKKYKKRPRSDSEEEKKKRLRSDPLLTVKLPSPSPLSGDETEALLTPIRESKKEDITKIKSSSESEDDEGEQKKKKKNQFFKSNERVFISSEGSSDDSDLEFIGSFPSTEVGDKGRKKIRAIISTEMLATDTKNALRSEEERIQRLGEQMKRLSQSLSQRDEEMEAGMVLDICKDSGKPIIVVDSVLTNKLKEHQKEGIRFMWNNCYESVERLKTSEGIGCVLAHCMGLGKSLQAITLIHTLFNHPVTKTKHVLIVSPLSTVLNWKNEFKIMLRGVSGVNINLKIISDRKTKAQKSITISSWYASGGVLIMGYDCFAWLVKDLKENTPDISSVLYKALLAPGPDLIICDEGHLIKNKKNRRTKALMRVKTKRRIILTGTPLQNSLEELYQMVQYVKANLLGTKDEFMNRFGHPILNGGYYDSNARDIKIMQKRSHVLHTYLKETVQRYEVSELRRYLPEKVEYVVFISMHPVQIELYKYYLQLTKSDKHTSKQFLSDYVTLRNVWTHPWLLQLKEKEKSKIKENPKRNDDVILTDNTVQCIPTIWYRQKSPTDIQALEIGSKLQVVMSIIDECEKIGEKIIVFTSFLANLDIIAHYLRNYGTSQCRTWREKVDYLRMDGSVPVDIRNEYCNNFTSDDKIRVFLISHKVGGMGLNLFAANRIILMDVSFNPAMDNQSVYRIYRFGQKKKCYIYRLVSMGTMEETVYERSVTKSAISARVVDEQQITRHFKRSDLDQMYRFKDTSSESRPIPRIPKDTVLAKIIQKHKEVFKYHDYQVLLENQLNEQLNEKEQQAAWEEFRIEQENARLQAEARVAIAQVPNDPKMLAAAPNANPVPLVNSHASATIAHNKSLPSGKLNEISTKTNPIKRTATHTDIEFDKQLATMNLEKQIYNKPAPFAQPSGLAQRKAADNQPISLFKSAGTYNEKQNAAPSTDSVVVLVNDKVIQSEKGGQLVRIDLENQCQHHDNVQNNQPENYYKPLQTASTSHVSQKPSSSYQQKNQQSSKQVQKTPQNPSPKPMIKPVDLNTLVEKSRECLQEPGSSGAAFLRTLQQTMPELYNSFINGGIGRASTETINSIAKEDKNITTNRRNSTPSVTLPSNVARVLNPVRRFTVDSIGSSTNSAFYIKDRSTNKNQSQQSQNPIDLVLKADGNQKKKNDVIEIQD